MNISGENIMINNNNNDDMEFSRSRHSANLNV